jgi:hypothetical protein
MKIDAVDTASMPKTMARMGGMRGLEDGFIVEG